MIELLTLEKILKLEYLSLWKLWEELAINWTSLDNIHERLSAKHYKHDIEFRFWDFNDGNFEGVFNFICDCEDSIFKNPNRFVKSNYLMSLLWTAKVFNSFAHLDDADDRLFVMAGNSLVVFCRAMDDYGLFLGATIPNSYAWICSSK